MSALIKPSATDSVRPFAARAATVAAIAPVERPDPRDAEIAGLRASLAEARKALDEASAAGALAVERAREQGRTAGLTEAEDREAERLALVEEMLDTARSEFEARIDAIDGLAAQLAAAALGKILDQPQPMAEHVAGAIARQLRELRRASVIGLHVSPDDFSDLAALEPIAPGVSAALDPELASGKARIDCRLGELDIDVPAQWAAVCALLETLAQEPRS